MLCDDIARSLRERRGALPDKAGAAADTADAIEQAQRFVLSPLTVETIDGLADPATVENCRPFLFTPAALTWIEWRDGNAGSPTSNRHGLLLAGHEGSITNGDAIYVCDITTESGERTPMAQPLEYSFPPGCALLRDSGPASPELILKRCGVTGGRFDRERLGAWLGAALAPIL